MNTKSIRELIDTYTKEAVAAGDDEEAALLLDIALSARKLLFYIENRDLKNNLKVDRMNHKLSLSTLKNL